MEAEKLVLIKSDLTAQMAEIEVIYSRLEDRKKSKGSTALESIGYQLHNLYCAFEDLFLIVAGYFENNIQDKTRFHSELLKRMNIAIEGIRPNLLTPESFILLDNLRSFRHFFRHGYSHELDARKIKIVLMDAEKLKGGYRHEVELFLRKLAE